MQIVTSWMEQGLQQGRKEGRKEGKKEGRKEGRKEGELLLILRLLTRKVGTVNPELQERIRRLSIAQLEELGEALLEFSNLAMLECWLDDHTQSIPCTESVSDNRTE